MTIFDWFLIWILAVLLMVFLASLFVKDVKKPEPPSEPAPTMTRREKDRQNVRAR